MLALLIINCAGLYSDRAAKCSGRTSPDGGLVDDFLIVNGLHAIQLCNAPSATALLEIGRVIETRNRTTVCSKSV